MTSTQPPPPLPKKPRKWPPAVAAVLIDTRRLEELREADAWDDVISILRRATSTMQAHGLQSPWLTWQLAVALDTSGEGLQALRCVDEALAQDPVCGHFLETREIIVKRLRASACCADPRPPDAHLQALYAALAALGEADAPTHLAMAAWLLDKGRAAEARRLTSAVVTLSPADAAAWALHATALGAVGEAAAAKEAVDRAEALRAAEGQGVTTLPEARG